MRIGDGVDDEVDDGVDDGVGVRANLTMSRSLWHGQSKITHNRQMTKP
ncbi:hypothetical protein N8979_00850 [bacterium]|nr:hypothetical protein [bacterium]